MKKLYGILLIVLVMFLSACSDSSMLSDVEKTRNLLNGRFGDDTGEKGDSGSKTTRKWYSWQLDTKATEFKAPDGTTLLEATVTNVVDGDTVDLKITNGKEERARLILIDTPESKGKYEDNPQPYAIPAYEFTKATLEGKKVWIEKGIGERDQYKRLLVYIWLDNVVLNEEVETEDKETAIIGEKIGMVTMNELLLREGLAEVAIFPPNTKYVDEFEAVEKKAKKERKGLWSR